jgi:hypothetical protein
VKNHGVKIKITNSKTIAELRSDFNRAFPYLKIEFYSVPYKEKTLLPAAKLIRHDALIAQCRKTGQDGELVLKPDDTVAALEDALWEQFGLSAQVFRKSGSLWIETSLTDSWTLKQQNFEGEQMSMANNSDTATGIDLYDRDQAE